MHKKKSLEGFLSEADCLRIHETSLVKHSRNSVCDCIVIVSCIFIHRIHLYIIHWLCPVYGVRVCGVIAAVPCLRLSPPVCLMIWVA